MTLVFEPVSVDHDTARMLVESMAYFGRVGPEGYNGCSLQRFDRKGRGGASGRQATSWLEMDVYPWSEGRPALIWTYRGDNEGLSGPIVVAVRSVRIVGRRLVVSGRMRIGDSEESSWSCPIVGEMPEVPATERRGQTTLEAFA